MTMAAPPQLIIKLPKTSDLPNTSKPWDNADLPIDVLLLTVEDCEFLSCFYYLDKPFRSYCGDIGHVYFGYMGRGEQNKLKIALIKCSKGSAVPGGSLTVVKNAVRILCPKAVFSVGTCIGLNAEKTKLGDVVVSSKLTTSIYRTPVSRNIGNLIRHVADGWKAPLENPDAWEVRVHCDGDVLSHPAAASFGWRHEQIIQKYPEAIAVETEGEGVFAAAHDDKMEWMLVKGVASYEECNRSLSSDKWKCFASTTAASVVANILSDPVIFQEWLHYNQGSFSTEQSAIRSNDIISGWSEASGSSKQVHCDQEAYPVKPFDVKTCRSKLAEHYNRTAKVPTSVWSLVGEVKLDQIYTRLSWVKKEQTPAGPLQSKLTHYSDLFTADEKGFVPKRILVQGQTGIGKSTFVKKLMVDWAQLDDGKTGDEQAATRRRFETYEGGEDVSEARNKKGIQDDEGMLFSEDDESTSSEDDEWTSSEKIEITNGNGIDVLRKFELVLVVTLKEVSSCQTLKEVISRSRLFPKDEEISTDELLSYVRSNQEQVLLAFDGFDEYRAGSEAEAKFGSRSNSPICEIFHGNYLRDCTVLVTSRSSRADELQRSAHKHAKITGFDIEDQRAFMKKMLDSDHQVDQLLEVLKKKGMEDLARVPLLNLFFCLLWRQEKKKRMELVRTKTKLYQAIIRHILQYSHKKHSPATVSKVKEENYNEILNEIGKVALESLLNGNQVFEYGQLSENVRGERSFIVGLLQLSEYGASLEPMEMVSFIHKSIQEYLAGWYITNKCVSVDNLGGIEEHAHTLEDCEALENVFQFICGLSSEGAVKVSKHLSTVRVCDSLDVSKIVPDEESETYVPLCDVTRRHERFNDLALNCFREVSSEAELVKHWFECTGGIVYLTRPLGPELLPNPEVLIQAAHSWAILFHNCLVCKSLEFFSKPVNNLHESVEFLNLFHIPLRITESSEMLKLGDFLSKFLDIQCMDCRFSSILCCRDSQIQCYITTLTLRCDAHSRVFTEAAATISIQSLSANLCSNQSCLKFLTSLNCLIYPNGELMKVLGAEIRNCKHLQRIILAGSADYACDLLEQVQNPGPCYLEIGDYDRCTLTSAGTERFAAVLPRFPNISTLRLDLRDCCAESVTKLVTSITHKTLKKLHLRNISFTPASAAALGRMLPEMTSLRRLALTGKDGSILHAEEMEALFGGFNKTLCLENLDFTHFRVRGNLGPLMKSLRFFPNLSGLSLGELDVDGDGLCLLLDSVRFIPNLELLILNGNPLGHAVTSIVPHLINLPKLQVLYIDNINCSKKDLNYVRKAAKAVRPLLTVC